jgi:hypothetical protein
MRGTGGWLLGAALCVFACSGPPQRTQVPEAQLAALSRRVEAARELRFRAPVAAESIAPAAVPELLAAEFDLASPPEQLRREQALGAALGLLPADADLRSVLLGWQAHAVAGFYSPSSGRLFVVEGAAGAGGGAESGVLVHELAHALQHQHTRLLDARTGLRENDDVIFALGAFLEGDALWTELRDEAGTTGFPQASGRDFAKRFAVDAPEGEGVPRLLRDSFLRQYPLGYALAAELVERGGVAALTAALSDPPLSSEELLHRERYLSRAQRRPLAWLPEAVDGFSPEPGCQLVATTSFGELGVGIWLAEHGASPSESDAAADGWDGDRAWLLGCPAGDAVAWLIQTDEPREASELEAAAVRAASRTGARGPLVIERRGVRVLLSAGLPPLGRAYLLETLEARRYESLDALLRERPEVLVRAAEQRRTAR